MFAVTLSAGALIALLLVTWWRLERNLRTLDAQIARSAAIAADQQRRAEAQRRLARAQQFTEEAVALTNTTVRAVHQGIANIPFTLLTANPGTGEQARRAKRIHDATSQWVYDGIARVNRRLGAEIRRSIQSASDSESDNRSNHRRDPPEKS